jgi:iron complex outermembrane recepter protein
VKGNINIYLAGASLIASSTPCFAQSATPDNNVAEVVVTGSRIPSGFEQPTPVTVVTSEQLQVAQPAGIAAAINQLPQFSGSVSPRLTQSNTQAGSPVGNFLNLRNVGTRRTLILQDGVRVPPTTAQGDVSTDAIPEMLVSRVDVVTGGVSAVYGSDAVSGVVNFILDKTFTGVRGLAQGGVSEMGDATSYRVGLALGHGFADDRVHVLFSLDRNEQDGLQRQDRKLFLQRWFAVPEKPGVAGTADNPLVFKTNVVSNLYTTGAKLTAGPPSLLPSYYDAAGVLRPFDTGGFAGVTTQQIGGSGLGLPGDRSLFPLTRVDHAFGRISYDVTPKVNVFAEFNGSSTFVKSAYASEFLSTPVYIENPYLTPAVLSAIAAAPGAAQRNNSVAACGAGNSSPVLCLFKGGTELGGPYQDQRIRNYSAKAGVTADIGGWNLDATYVHGYVQLRSKGYNDTNLQHYYAAVDAVRNPANGEIVCRVTLTNPGLYPGCTPFNALGGIVPSQAVLDYVQGVSQYETTNKTDDFVVNFAGEKFSTWAGPIGWAFGAEYRKASLEQTSNSDPNVPYEKTGLRGVPPTLLRYGVTNQGVASGKNNVKEANAEVLVPLAKDAPFAHSLTVTGAVRYTDYSTSGSVWTWKAGATWEPIDEVRFRITRSRDIRAPTLYDLFQGGTSVPIAITDPHCNCVRQGAGSVQQKGGGNPDLTPEIAKTFTAGMVFKPNFLPRFVASVDYYDIKIKDALVQLSAIQILQDCENSGGASPVCANITRPLPFSDHSPANALTSVFVGQINAAELETSGLDFEVTYSMPTDLIWPGGNLDFRLLANYVDKFVTQQFASVAPVETAGYRDPAPGFVPLPKWRGTLSANYRNGPFSVYAQERMVGSLKWGRTFVYAANRIPATYYTDLTATYSLPVEGGKVDTFLTVSNLWNQQPRVVPETGFPGVGYPTILQLYDVIGRYYTVGARFRF